MKALVIGNGAREHALVKALVNSGCSTYVFMNMNNPGITKIATSFIIDDYLDNKKVINYAKEIKPDFAIIGPEAPLEKGIVDDLKKIKIPSVGPTKKNAQIETSKGFTRKLMQKHKIAGLPKFKTFKKPDGIKEFLEELGKYVIKPDGLTGGKGVLVYGEHVSDIDEAYELCREILQSHKGVVIEEKLEGEEFSLMSITDGKTLADFPPIQDHKRINEGDQGPNTGGMGSYSLPENLPFLNKEDLKQAHEITEKVLHALQKETKQKYKGVLYGGFMKTQDGIKLIEYNARFGDPEAMNAMDLLVNDFSKVCKAIIDGKLDKIKLEFFEKATVCKYVVPKGYPQKSVKGPIIIPEVDPLKVSVYYAAVEENKDQILMTGSRAIAFVGISEDIEQAEKYAEEAASKVQGEVYHRKDIGTMTLIQKRLDHMMQIMSEKPLIPLYTPKKTPMRVAILMSGTGSITEKIISREKQYKKRGENPYEVKLIVTDNPKSRAKEIADKYSIDYYENNIKEFYAKKKKPITDMKVREQFDKLIQKELKKHEIDVVALCGYMRVVTKNIVNNYLTLNIHPADLTIMQDGKRKYAGLMGEDAIKAQIKAGEKTVASTLHIVTDKVDEGPIIMVSEEVSVEKEELSKQYHEELKKRGDWIIYPEVIALLSEGRVEKDEHGHIYIDGQKVE